MDGRSDPTRQEQFVPSVRVSRRVLLQTTGAGAGAVAAGLAGSGSLLAAGGTRPMPAWMAALVQTTPVDLDTYEPVALTADELTVLKAAIDRLIPPDEIGPGAVEAGVFVYIDRALAGALADSLPAYQAGLAALDAAAGSTGFAESTPVDQDAILTQAEAGELLDGPDGFFNLLLNHTRQGMFSDPIYGGNRDFIGWDLIGYPGIRLVWTAEEQAINATIEPAHVSVAEFGGEAS